MARVRERRQPRRKKTALEKFYEKRPWCYVDPRWEQQTGPIMDIGCLDWTWSEQFAGKRDVIGYDPFEGYCPPWGTLYKEAVSPIGADGGWLFEHKDVTAASAFLPHGETRFWRLERVPVCSFFVILQQHKPCLVKLNVEGLEYALLTSCEHPVADQLVVAFHGWMHQRWEGLEAHIISWLRSWYEPILIHEPWQWWLFLKK